jgi:hypothetical protein
MFALLGSKLFSITNQAPYSIGTFVSIAGSCAIVSIPQCILKLKAYPSTISQSAVNAS